MKKKLMAILNITPDSCYSPSAFYDLEAAVARGVQLYHEGADLIDIGGESTRPGALPVPLEEEMRRVIPVIKALRKAQPLPLSIDTMKPEVAEAALNEGVAFINDVTGFQNPAMQKLAAESKADICVMHMQGSPQTMQDSPMYPEGVIAHLKDWFSRRVDLLLKVGVNPDKVWLDPGIGFGKTVADNLKIIENLPVLHQMGYRLLLGSSRKSFMMKLLDKKKREELLPATLSVNLIALSKGVDMIRIHDVREHYDMMRIYDLLKSQ